MGEDKVKEIKKAVQKKKIVETNIGPTEEDFLRKVARETPEGKPIRFVETYLGFGLSKKNLKRVFDYIKSWLIRYDVKYEAINPYLTLYLLDEVPTVSALIKNIKSTKRGVVYNPRGTITVTECSPNKDQIVLDYVPNLQYQGILEQLFHDMRTVVVDKYCYVKLFEIEQGKMTPMMYEDMMYSCPAIPNLRLGNVGVLRRKINANL